MRDTKKLVEALRALSDELKYDDFYGEDMHDVIADAADEIEFLKAELAYAEWLLGKQPVEPKRG